MINENEVITRTAAALVMKPNEVRQVVDEWMNQYASAHLRDRREQRRAASQKPAEPPVADAGTSPPKRRSRTAEKRTAGGVSDSVIDSNYDGEHA